MTNEECKNIMLPPSYIHIDRVCQENYPLITIVSHLIK